jgi:hypothetical protein
MTNTNNFETIVTIMIIKSVSKLLSTLCLKSKQPPHCLRLLLQKRVRNTALNSCLCPHLGVSESCIDFRRSSEKVLVKKTYVKANGKFALEQAMKVQRKSRSIALFFL